MGKLRPGGRTGRGLPRRREAGAKARPGVLLSRRLSRDPKMPGGDRGFHLGRRIRAVWLFLVCEWGNRGTEEAFWERAKATQAVSELSRLVPQLSGSQAGWGMTGAGAPGHWLRGGGHRGGSMGLAEDRDGVEQAAPSGGE